MINYILDTLYELYEYLKPQSRVYIAGVKLQNRYILTRMIPENVDLPEGYERLTESMNKDKAEKRITHFKLIRIIH